MSKQAMYSLYRDGKFKQTFKAIEDKATQAAQDDDTQKRIYLALIGSVSAYLLYKTAGALRPKP